MQRSKAQDGHEGQQHWVWSGCTFLFTLICTVYIISLARIANHGVVENEIEMGKGRERRAKSGQWNVCIETNSSYSSGIWRETVQKLAELFVRRARRCLLRAWDPSLGRELFIGIPCNGIRIVQKEKSEKNKKTNGKTRRVYQK